jgi:hypothetical protein
METALAAIESLRSRAEDPTLQASFLDRKYDYYVHLIDLLLQLYEKEPIADFDRRALGVAERAHSRSTLDLLKRP